jgi:predicted peptidase
MDDAERAYAIDRRRVYLTGLSTGGYGVWKLGARHADRFAALVPVCPGGGTEFAAQLTALPIWAFHLAFDPIVFSSGTRATVDRINKLGGHARATIYPGIGHNCWDRAYDDPALWKWLLAQSK